MVSTSSTFPFTPQRTVHTLEQRETAVRAKQIEMQFLTFHRQKLGQISNRALSLYDDALMSKMGLTQQTRASNAWSKLKQLNPFVLFGTATTVYALQNGLKSLREGDSIKQQHMMRLRVGAQFFTIISCVLASWLFTPMLKQFKIERMGKELDKMPEEGEINT